MAQKKEKLPKKTTEFDRRLEMKIFAMFLLLFIVPTGMIMLSYMHYSKNDGLLSLLAIVSMVLILICLFYYSKKLDVRDEFCEKYD